MAEATAHVGPLSDEERAALACTCCCGRRGAPAGTGRKAHRGHRLRVTTCESSRRAADRAAAAFTLRKRQRGLEGWSR